jgi:hypothetical protein
MVGKNGRMLSQSTTPLEFVLQFTKGPAAIHLHEFGFEQAFNRVPSHIHRTTPPPGVEQCAGILQTMSTRFGLIAYTRV